MTVHDLDSHTFRFGRHEKRGRHERRPVGVLTVPKLTPEQLDKLAAEWIRQYGKGHVTYEPRTTREALSRSGR